MSVELDELRAAVDHGSPAVAAEAAMLLGKLIVEPAHLDTADAELPRFLAWARQATPTPQQVIWGMSGLARAVAVATIVRQLRTTPDQPVPVPEHLVGLAERGFEMLPELPLARNALGYARLLEDRYVEIRALYIGVQFPDGLMNAEGQAIRAFAELAHGDVAAARRLVAAAQGAAPKHLLVIMAREMLDGGRQPDTAGPAT